ncbi:MAG: ABC transporter permease [Acidisphaera sp.]|nr:ABC transporter permease [Acidisphaera sp.]
MLDRVDQAARPALAGRPMPFRGGGFEITPRRWLAPGAFALVLAAWQLGSSLGLINPMFLPSPLAILAALRDAALSGALWINLSASLVRFGGGWVLGTAAGLLVGLVMGIFSAARAIGLAGISALFPIPKIALLPLLILWLGIGETSKVTTIALGVFFPMAVATYSAIDAVPRNLIRMAQSFNLGWSAIVARIILPGALPGILAGMRITVSVGLTLLAAAEMIGARYGIGAFILAAGNLMLPDQLLAGVVVLSLLGLGLAWLLGRAERVLLRWR